ncbi:rhodanese-like domain-containing protein [Methylocaldum sp.]|uniref:rhodanese-like domain-containing protein n=1 Tax=Methylocaldum sp. TaxID=1969727 RepID=UPI002D2A4AC1|nr:rhodanese-like domain-containing protein [Methylocaldum sp.]HYE38057.1 rhodanese-like domain-containing protein [Methylocaldum sp.]
MRDILPSELRSYLETAEPKPLLLDVREPQEYAYCHIEGSAHIPMNDIPSRLGELHPQQEIVVICHHGMRSRMVGDYLTHQGFSNIVNLRGGVDAWATEVDPNMPQY